MIGIYKITNPKGRVYVGQSIEIHNRKYKYQTACCKNQTKIYRSIKKYGWSSHKFEVIELCAKEELNEKEYFYINYYNSFKNGLNCTVGGGQFNLSAEHKEKIAKSLRGRKRLFCTVYKMKLARLKNPYKMPDSEKENLRLQRNPKFIYSNRKVVLDTQTGVFYDSAKCVSKLYGFNYNTFHGRLGGHKINNTQFIYA